MIVNCISDFECCPLGTNPFHFQYTGFRTFVHLVTRHAREISDNVWFRIIEPFDKGSWIAIGMCLLLLSVVFFASYFIYSKVCPQRIESKLDLEYLMFRSLFGLSEPDEIKSTNTPSGKMSISI